MASISTPVSQNFILSAVGNCAVTAFNGMRDSLTGAAKSLQTLFTNPGQLWHSAVETFRNLRSVVTTIADSFSKIPELLTGMAPTMLQGLICGVVGKLGLTLVKALTPAGLVVLAARLVSVIDEIKKSITTLMKFATSKVTDKAKRFFSSEIGLCAVQ